MRETVSRLLSLLNFTDIRSDDIRNYIEPYDIFEGNDHFWLIKNFDNSEGIQKTVAQRASREISFRFCNYPNEVSFESYRSILKTGTRSGVVVMSEQPVTQSCIVKFKIVREGNKGQGCIGFGLCDKFGLNYCPFLPSQSSGLFAAYFSSNGIGWLNLASLGDKFIPEEYNRNFGQGDSVNLAIDLETNAVSYGINDVTLPDKRLNLKKVPALHLAIWLQEPGDEVEVAFET